MTPSDVRELMYAICEAAGEGECYCRLHMKGEMCPQEVKLAEACLAHLEAKGWRKET